MKNDMKLIMESWRSSSILLESVADAIENKTIQPDDVAKIGKKHLQDPGFQQALEMFAALSKADPDADGEIDEGAMDWINLKIIQGMQAGENLSDTLKSDPKFAPMLKLSGAGLALAFLSFKMESGGLNPEDGLTAAQILSLKGKIPLDNLADAVLYEETKF